MPALAKLDSETDATVAYRPAVQLNHRRHVRGRARHKALVGRVQLGAVDVALDDVDAQLVAGQLHDGVAGDADEHVGRWRRGE